MNAQKITFNYIMENCRKKYKTAQLSGEKRERKGKPKSFAEAIEKAKDAGKNAIISEIKFASPSGDILKAKLSVGEIAKAMKRGGACALSVLTEENFFKGKLGYLSEAGNYVSIPLLRKDFLFSPAQISEAYYCGADAVLLIPALLSLNELKKLSEEANMFRLEPIFEIHSKADIEKARLCKAEIFLINNRDKDTLEIDLPKTEKLSKFIDGLKISASGISSKEELKYVLKFTDAALIGGSIMRLGNLKEIEKKVAEFCEA